jgi:hypothetical protein
MKKLKLKIRQDEQDNTGSPTSNVRRENSCQGGLPPLKNIKLQRMQRENNYEQGFVTRKKNLSEYYHPEE